MKLTRLIGFLICAGLCYGADTATAAPKVSDAAKASVTKALLDKANAQAALAQLAKEVAAAQKKADDALAAADAAINASLVAAQQACGKQTLDGKAFQDKGELNCIEAPKETK